MTKEEFNKLWTLKYPDMTPISHLVRSTYPDRWFRIHSLPESKRYPENNMEWETVLSRQNEIITDLFGIGTSIFIITGEYNWGNQRTKHVSEEDIFSNYSFTLLDNIDLFKIDSEEYDEIDIYRPAFAVTTWAPNKHDNLLREIAKDDARAILISFDKNIVVAPYDGGIDFLLQDSLTKNIYKNKYEL